MAAYARPTYMHKLGQTRAAAASLIATAAAKLVPTAEPTTENKRTAMNLVLKEIRDNPLLWLLVFVPVVFVAAKLKPEAHTLLFVLSVLAIVPLAALLSHATESVAAKTGDAVGGLLNATLGNLTELVIALTALARRAVHAREGLHRGTDRHQHAVHAGCVVPARRTQAPRAGIQSGQRPPAGRDALSGHDRVADSFGRLARRLGGSRRSARS